MLRQPRPWMGLAVLCLALAGCDESPTTLRLQISADPALAIDQLNIVVGDATPQLSVALPEVRVVVPDDWAATAVAVAVDGLADDAVVASGSATVRPMRHGELATEITLRPVTCPDACPRDATRCAGDAVETCLRRDDGCLIWGVATACPSEAPICSNGTCATTCADECTAGATLCDGASGQRTCANIDGDGCFEWAPVVACGPEERCIGAACTAAATLTVAKAGPGVGLVASTPVGIRCGTDCSEAYAVGTAVTLTATPANGAIFIGWSGGGCEGAGACTVTLAAATTITATFDGECVPMCSTPPAAACVDSETLRTFTSPGTCTSGTCDYTSTDTSCDGGCASGRCRSWTGALPIAGAPAARGFHTAIWTGAEMIVWGGESGATRFADGARFNVATGSWTPLPTTGAPSARTGHSAVWTGTDMIVWGGWDGTTNFATGARFNPATGGWTPLPATGAPSARRVHSAVWTGTEMIVWGGWSGTGVVGDGARFNPTTGAWTPLPAMDAPTARAAHSAIWTGTEMIIWGGVAGGTAVDGGRFSPATGVWTRLPASHVAALRQNHSAVWTGTEMIVWGGYAGAYLADGARFTPATDIWLTLPMAGAPSARYGHSAVWTGSSMLVWGGHYNNSALNTGATYR